MSRSSAPQSGARARDLAALAAEAYVYGFPLVYDLETVAAFIQHGFGNLPGTPFNRFAHARQLATPETPAVSAGTDTLYSIAQLDLSEGPLVLQVPDTAGRYYVLQFVDAWTDNVAYLGQRATGTEAGSWLLVPPGWSGQAPGSVRGVIEAPTTVMSLVGRIACAGEDDVPAVRALQRGFTLHSLTAPGLGRGGLPTPDPQAPPELRFFERLRVWAADFPPSSADQRYQERFQPLGLLEEGPTPYAGASRAFVAALEEGMAAGRAEIDAAAWCPPPRGGGGWQMEPHLFDYNLDHFGIGTVDSPRWRLPDRTASYLTRAVAASVGLWGRHGYETVYAQTFQDTEGRPLDGAYAYTLRFPQPPPARAFWSLTMYGLPERRLVANPAGRYAIGPGTPGLVYDADGGLTLHVQHRRPRDPARAANWLPAPAGIFRPMLRLYLPAPEVLDGSYVLPGLLRSAAPA